MAEASEADRELVYQLGIALGMAFQIKDDYLDTYGTFETLGKRIGDDILCKKKTFLLLTALEKASDYERSELIKKLNAETSDEQKIKDVTDIFDHLGVPETTVAKIDEYYKEAKQLLDEISVDESHKTDIRNLIEKLKVREK